MYIISKDISKQIQIYLRPLHLGTNRSYDNGAYFDSDIAYACHPHSLYGGVMTSKQAFVAGNDQEVALKVDRLILPHMT